MIIIQRRVIVIEVIFGLTRVTVIVLGPRRC